jgi:hypothetical protein
MNIIIERVISQTINKFINENCSRSSVITENDGDDMGIYKELDDKVIDICYRHDFNVQTRVGNDLAYYAFFIADDRLPKVQEAIQIHPHPSHSQRCYATSYQRLVSWSLLNDLESWEYALTCASISPYHRCTPHRTLQYHQMPLHRSEDRADVPSEAYTKP